MAQANSTTATDTIRFADAVEGGGPLVLTGGELAVSRDLRIDGDKNDDGTGVTISGGGDSRILSIAGTADVGLEDLVLTDGSNAAGIDNGGAVLLGDGGGLALDGCEVRDSSPGAYGSTYGRGGGIYAGAGSRVTVTDSLLTGNFAGRGGGIFAEGDVELLIRGSRIEGNSADSGGGGLSVGNGSTLTLEDSVLSGNGAVYENGNGGGIDISGSDAAIIRTSIVGNVANSGGGISAGESRVLLQDSTIADNVARREFIGDTGGGGISAGGDGALVIHNSTITGNVAGPPDPGYTANGGGISARGTSLDIANSIVAGNGLERGEGPAGVGPDIAGTITRSDGHNVFGSDVDGAITGDREGVAAGVIFAAVDPDTGGGRLNAEDIVPLRTNVSNPALSGGDPLAALARDQLGGARPVPADTLPDIGADETTFAPSTRSSANNDNLTGTDRADTVAAQAGNDLVRGGAGSDRLSGNDGSDVLDGGVGNDRLDGGTGIDLAAFSGTTGVVVDLSGASDTARRGAETDGLSGIEGAIGSSGADTFRGDGLTNLFQGGAGSDVFTGGGGRDLFDFDRVGDSPTGAGRDVVTDFRRGTDDLDLSGIDADTTVSGDQAFTFVGTGSLAGGPGRVGFTTSGGDTIVRGSTDADSAAEFEIQLNGVVNPGRDDFYL